VISESGLSKAVAAKRIEALQRELSRKRSVTDAGDGGASIRANERPPEDQPLLR